MYHAQLEKLGLDTITDTGIGTVEGSHRELVLVAKSVWKAVWSAARTESVVKNEHDSHSYGILNGSYSRNSSISSSRIRSISSSYSLEDSYMMGY